MTDTEGERPGGPEPTLLRSSMDSANLNDDLIRPEELELSSSLILLLSSSNHHNNRHLSSFALSVRNSMDADSSFQLSSYFFNTASSSVGNSNLFNPEESQYIQDIQNDTTSPLGPNSIYKLTVGSDIARQQRNRSLKSHVVINGGQTAVYNLQAPTTQAIPQVKLLSLKTRIKTADLYAKYLDQGQDSEYKRFESSGNKLTESVLQKFTTEQERLVSQKVKLVVPDVFSSADFHLDDPRTFKAIMGNTSILKDSEEHESTHDTLAYNTQIQEGLSQYLDLVEQQLVLEISNSLDLFFSTLDMIQSIEGKSQNTLLMYDDLIAQLTNLKDNTSAHALQILDQMKKKRNVEKLEFSLLQIQAILQMYDLCISSFAKLDYNLCLKQLILLEHLIAGTAKCDIAPDIDTSFYPNYELLDMTGIPALWDLQNNAGKLKSTCVKQYQTAFVNALLEDLRLHYHSVPQEETLSRLSLYRKKGNSNGSAHGKYSVPESTREILKTFIINLSNSGNLREAYAEYQDHIVTEIKDIIKVNLPRKAHAPHLGIGASPAHSASTSRASSEPPNSADVSIDDVNLGSSNVALASHAANIKAMSNDDFYSLLAKVFTNTSECLRRLTLHQKLLLDFALSYVDIQNPQKPQIDVFYFDITPALSKAIEITQIRLAKIINVRLELIADLSVDNYLHFYSLTSAFLHECELIAPNFNTNGSANTLSDWSRVHITYFIHRLHLNAVKNLVAESLKEIWKEVVDEKQLSMAQNRVNEILAYSSFLYSQGRSGDPTEQWLEAMDITKNVPESEDGFATVENSRIKISQTLFLLPRLGLLAINATRDYFVLLKVFLSRSSTIENYLLTYFKVLNSKTSQAILGAGATRTAGLKHIFPKHMALSIQLVGFVISLLEELRNAFPNSSLSIGHNSTELNSSSPSEDVTFSTIISNYKDHQNEIFGKLISMMYDRTVNHCNVIKSIDWSQPIRHPQQCHPFMETLVKDTTTITKVLVKYLPEVEVALILLQVFDNYKKLFVECFCTQIPPFKDLTEKNTALKDIDYFRVKLGECPGYGNSGQVIWENINSMPTEEDTRMEEVMRNNIAKEMKSKEKKELAIQKGIDDSAPTSKIEKEPNDKDSARAIAESPHVNLLEVPKNISSNERNEGSPAIALSDDSRSNSPEKVISLTIEGNAGVKDASDIKEAIDVDHTDSKDIEDVEDEKMAAQDETTGKVTTAPEVVKEDFANGKLHNLDSPNDVKEKDSKEPMDTSADVVVSESVENKSENLIKNELNGITEGITEDNVVPKEEEKLEDKDIEVKEMKQDELSNPKEVTESDDNNKSGEQESGIEKAVDSKEAKTSGVFSDKKEFNEKKDDDIHSQEKDKNPTNIEDGVSETNLELPPKTLEPPPPHSANKSPKKKKNNKRKNKKH